MSRSKILAARCVITGVAHFLQNLHLNCLFLRLPLPLEISPSFPQNLHLGRESITSLSRVYSSSNTSHYSIERIHFSLELDEEI